MWRRCRRRKPRKDNRGSSVICRHLLIFKYRSPNNLEKSNFRLNFRWRTNSRLRIHHSDAGVCGHRARNYCRKSNAHIINDTRSRYLVARGPVLMNHAQSVWSLRDNGRSITMVVPSPSTELNRSSPPWSSTICLTIDSPRPVPGIACFCALLAR